MILGMAARRGLDLSSLAPDPEAASTRVDLNEDGSEGWTRWGIEMEWPARPPIVRPAGYRPAPAPRPARLMPPLPNATNADELARQCAEYMWQAGLPVDRLRAALDRRFGAPRP